MKCCSDQLEEVENEREESVVESDKVSEQKEDILEEDVQDEDMQEDEQEKEEGEKLIKEDKEEKKFEKKNTDEEKVEKSKEEIEVEEESFDFNDLDQDSYTEDNLTSQRVSTKRGEKQNTQRISGKDDEQILRHNTIQEEDNSSDKSMSLKENNDIACGKNAKSSHTITSKNSEPYQSESSSKIVSESVNTQQVAEFIDEVFERAIDIELSSTSSNRSKVKHVEFKFLKQESSKMDSPPNMESKGQKPKNPSSNHSSHRYPSHNL